MRLLVTRPEPEATALAASLEARGHEVLVEPLLTIELLPVEPVDLEGAQALIATSRNAVRALAAASAIEELQALPLYVVGPGTAASARVLGFQNVVEGPSDAVALVALIALQAEVNSGPLVYLAGEVRAADIGGELRQLGFHVHEPTVYRAEVAKRLSRATVAAIDAGELKAVLLFSARTARTWARLTLAHGLARPVGKLRHLCLSAAVASGLGALGPLRIEVAAQPRTQEMLALIEGGAPQSPQK